MFKTVSFEDALANARYDADVMMWHDYPKREDRQGFVYEMKRRWELLTSLWWYLKRNFCKHNDVHHHDELGETQEARDQMNEDGFWGPTRFFHCRDCGHSWTKRIRR